MATTKQFNNQIPGLLAGASLAAKQYFPVKFASTAGEVIIATSAAAGVVSIIQNDPADGEPALLPGVGDICKAVAGASDITQGQFLTPNSTGLVDTTTGLIIAYSLEASAATGDYISVQIVKAFLG